ncbi:MAG TPA: hypothetical protein VNJ29_00425 [Candidatus Nitrosotenuis sp.]|nr:hypothetical protein [Candidatus Nitrosotenuis sp.]
MTRFTYLGSIIALLSPLPSIMAMENDVPAIVDICNSSNCSLTPKDIYMLDLVIDLTYRNLLSEAVPLTDDQKKLSRRMCVQNKHPIALLDHIERLFLEKVNTHTLLSQDECSEIKNLAQEALTSLIPESSIKHFQVGYEDYYPFFPKFVGLLGLQPHKIFENKSAFDTHDFQEIFSFWTRTFSEKKSLIKFRDGTNQGFVTLEDQYPTTHLWLQVIQSQGEQEPAFTYLIHRLLQLFDTLAEEVFFPDLLPWWRNPHWQHLKIRDYS